jgi:hypothetical protein
VLEWFKQKGKYDRRCNTLKTSGTSACGLPLTNFQARFIAFVAVITIAGQENRLFVPSTLARHPSWRPT